MQKFPKEFVFLYPIHEIFNHLIKKHGRRYKGGIKAFKNKYQDTLNQCIDIRYRQRNFGINFVVPKKSPISDIIKLQPSDRIIKTGLDYEIHNIKKSKKERIYTTEEYILSQIENTAIVYVAGFYMWNYVEWLAKTAYENELCVLVDEDLTEFLSVRIKKPDFKIDTYPGYDPVKNLCKKTLCAFIKKRREKPWLWQAY
ncbi:MAG: hypothetical protein V1829_02255 [bacterium]